jgi:hypothetical protein
MSTQPTNASDVCQPIGILQDLRRRLRTLGLPNLTRNQTQGIQQSSSNSSSTRPTRNRIRRGRRLQRPQPIPGEVRPTEHPGSDTGKAGTPPHQEIRHEDSCAPSWNLPRPPVQPFPLHLPDDILRTIFEFAAADLDSACALVLVATHVRAWIDPVLYSRVRLEGLQAIRLFARTVEDSILAEATMTKLQEDTIILPPRLYKPPSFFGCVRSLAIIPQEERVLLYFRDAVRGANIIIGACFNVIELEASGDFLRRTSVTAELLDAPSDPATGDGDSLEVSTGPNSAGPSTPIVAPHGLERALMRPIYLTLVPPTQNVNFKLAILSNLTHVHYSSTLPRTLNYQGSLLALTHVAFDYPLGITTTKAEVLLQLVRAALNWGTATEDFPSNDSHSDSNLHSDEDDRPLLAPRLTMVAVRVLLRPRVPRVGEVWRQLAFQSQTDPRLVYFESQGLFGEDIWEMARIESRSRERLSASWYRESP